jgi:hypothetical protein
MGEPAVPEAAGEPFVGPPPPEPAPVVPPGEPVLAPPSHHGLVLASAPVIPSATPIRVVASELPLAPLEERIRRLEDMLAHLESLQGRPERPGERGGSVQPAPAGPSVLGQARALLDAGRELLPNLPPGNVQAPGPRGWLVWEMIAEVRAMACMYLDPRYRLPLYGYVLPPVLVLAYLLSYYWVPFTSLLGKLSWLLTTPVDLLTLYALFKILSHEARRYRETAPDLPPSLRL